MTEPKASEQAVEYLQTAAIEAIKAVRSFLDVAESLVREPETAALVGKAFAEAAVAAFRPTTLSGDDAADHDYDQDDDDEDDDKERGTGGVRRIDLSD
jgi:hypothetical protein